jgi:hypothetical protein
MSLNSHRWRIAHRSRFSTEVYADCGSGAKLIGTMKVVQSGNLASRFVWNFGDGRIMSNEMPYGRRGLISFPGTLAVRETPRSFSGFIDGRFAQTGWGIALFTGSVSAGVIPSISEGGVKHYWPIVLNGRRVGACDTFWFDAWPIERKRSLKEAFARTFCRTLSSTAEFECLQDRPSLNALGIVLTLGHVVLQGLRDSDPI